MTDLIPLLRQFTPGAYGIWTLVMMGAVFFAREWRETRKLSAEDRLARRDGYAKQVETLMAENRQLGADLRQVREEYDAHRRQCYQETDQLRKMIIDAQNEAAGSNRRIDTLSLEIAKLKGYDA
jgi:outer membrane murein-binding lipoprotein Lpp